MDYTAPSIRKRLHHYQQPGSFLLIWERTLWKGRRSGINYIVSNNFEGRPLYDALSAVEMPTLDIAAGQFGAPSFIIRRSHAEEVRVYGVVWGILVVKKAGTRRTVVCQGFPQKWFLVRPGDGNAGLNRNINS